MIPFGVAMVIYKIVQPKAKFLAVSGEAKKIFNKASTENLKGKANSSIIRFLV